MESRLKTIIDNLKECFDGKPWYGDSVMKKLNSIDWQHVNHRPSGVRSIATLLRHIINWRIFVLKKLQGDATYDLVIDGPNDWSDVHIKNQGEWEQLKQELIQTQDDLLAVLGRSTDPILETEVPGKQYDFGPVLNSIAQHDIYHLGQIALIDSAVRS
ncbi:DinB family protein [Flavobacteriaceae bacterium TP-CH-4]|uniref:DinB family protein n=1 Tax=Pelagihabitans pacificus TaxID=2696054 RepID=A0A967E4J6_9FLAO|nr:DinB family protein [Pelagihabitans pacificus]NHF58457.1 DinB family protein [Pelagihabitans pacificus]